MHKGLQERQTIKADSRKHKKLKIKNILCFVLDKINQVCNNKSIRGGKAPETESHKRRQDMEKVFVSHFEDALALSKLGFQVHNLRGVGLDDPFVLVRLPTLLELGQVSKKLDAWHFNF